MIRPTSAALNSIPFQPGGEIGGGSCASFKGDYITFISILFFQSRAAMFRQSGRIHHSLGGGTLAGFPFIQEPEIQAEQAPEKREDDREQGF